MSAVTYEALVYNERRTAGDLRAKGIPVKWVWGRSLVTGDVGVSPSSVEAEEIGVPDSITAELSSRIDTLPVGVWTQIGPSAQPKEVHTQEEIDRMMRDEARAMRRYARGIRQEESEWGDRHKPNDRYSPFSEHDLEEFEEEGSEYEGNARKTRYIGFCPVCEGHFKCQAEHGRYYLVHHGYKRPGDGFIIGDCFGVGREPHEVSPELARDYRDPNEHEPNASYYVWVLGGDGLPLQTEGPYGPHDLDGAKTYARIAATEGSHDRAVSCGKDPASSSFDVVRVYRAGTGARAV